MFRVCNGGSQSIVITAEGMYGYSDPRSSRGLTLGH